MIEVACAIIVSDDGKVLVTQRSAEMNLPLKMEFPGGKIEPSETAEGCVVREVFEELQLDVVVVYQLPINEHHYPDFSIKLIPFMCKITKGTVVLKEHVAYSWLHKDELMDLDWAAADIPVVRNYLSFIK